MSLASSFSRIGLLRRLVRKELSEVLRDRRTIVTLVLMPLLLYPLLAVALRTFLLGSMVLPGPTIYWIGIHPGAEGRSVWRYLREGQRAIQERESPEELTAHRAPKGPLPPHQQPAPELRHKELEDLESAVIEGSVDVAIRPRPSGPFEVNRLNGDLALDWEVLYREDSSLGLETVRYLENVCAAANARLLAFRLYKRILPRKETPVRIRPSALQDPRPLRSALLAGLVPLILILMTITGAVYPAIDVTAGERERGTLEILAAAPVSRLSVLFAKYVAVFTVAMLTALVNLGTMAVTLYVSGVGESLFGTGGLSPWVLAQVLALLLLFAAFFSAVLLVLTSFARSFKEAQAYLVPLMLLALMPGVLSLVPGLRLQGPLAVAPLINIALLTRDLLEGTASAGVAVVVVLATLLYALAALALAARVFGAEAVLYSQQSSWGDLFHRPSEMRTAATPAAALMCLALLFPASFVVNGLLTLKGDQSLAGKLTERALANVLLFGCFPLVSAWLGRVRLSSALRMARPSWSGWVPALLLGLCLWPWTHEVILALRNAGMASLGAEYQDPVQEGLKPGREISLVLIVLVLAVLPAVLEELFFRGYLFSALLGAMRPWPAILASAALFGAFHLVLASLLAVERFLPSILLGIVLGWISWKTRSVWPGMLLHALHNGCGMLLRYYQPRSAELGWSVSGQDHLPITLLVASALTSVVGLVWVWRLGPSWSSLTSWRDTP
jgi:sodium transport system permease protein